MWYGGQNKPKPASFFNLEMFAVNVQYGNRQKPARVSQERWDAMWKWYQKRQEEGVSLEEIIKLESEF